MMTFRQISGLAAVGISLLIAGCAGNQPVRYSGIDSASKLTTNTDDNADRIPWRYSPLVDWRKYNNIIIDPVQIYQGNDGQFDDMAQADRHALAAYMQVEFSKTLSTRFKEVSKPAANTLHLKLTLTGADTTPQVVGTFTKFDLAGGPYNIVQSVRGGRGLMSGSVDYAVEIYDANSHELLKAYVARQYPNAMNISATIGSLSAAEVGIEKGAQELAEMLR
ncbi:uncharacterized protein DUF3313 [Raoultella sp. BIGb0138]|uniref:DUF3313 domain-containing protein n=1 Tax=Raoultella sp. BIGb0138 TaxID=2485115 RepID=UPI00104C1B88|nr:DUF3313 domain-containing protein [Raoultella sp. BIGb0138]TCW16371.1 uncharacterized protein DUF3313 [Raoultella sp. BIGb0138]